MMDGGSTVPLHKNILRVNFHQQIVRLKMSAGVRLRQTVINDVVHSTESCMDITYNLFGYNISYIIW